MSERHPFTDHNLPVSPEVPLEYIEGPDEDGYQRELYAFGTPELEDKYVVRTLLSGDINAARYSREERVGIMQDELARLQTAGVRLPRILYGLPEDWNRPSAADDESRQGVIVAVDRITPVDIRSVEPAVVAQQAHRTLAGMSKYLQDSWAPERVAQEKPYMEDVFKAEQFVYGVAPGETEPDFFMVDPVSAINHPESDDDSPYSVQQANIVEAARTFAQATGDDSLVDEARRMSVPFDALQR